MFLPVQVFKLVSWVHEPRLNMIAIVQSTGHVVQDFLLCDPHLIVSTIKKSQVLWLRWLPFTGFHIDDPFPSPKCATRDPFPLPRERTFSDVSLQFSASRQRFPLIINTETEPGDLGTSGFASEEKKECVELVPWPGWKLPLFKAGASYWIPLNPMISNWCQTMSSSAEGRFSTTQFAAHAPEDREQSAHLTQSLQLQAMDLLDHYQISNDVIVNSSLICPALKKTGFWVASHNVRATLSHQFQHSSGKRSICD